MALQSDLKGSQQELDDFKKNISLVDYAISKGYSLDKKKSSVRHKVLHSGDGNESILVSRMRDGASHFLNLHDPRDRGSLINFVMTRENLSLGETRKILRGFSGNAIYAPGQQAPWKPIAAAETFTSDQQSLAMAEVLKLSRTLSHPQYLHSRGLTEETLQSQAWKGRVFNNEHVDKAGNKHINTAFPIYNETGMISMEQRNAHFKGSLKDIPTSGGLFFSSHSLGPASHPVNKFVITEAPIDAMSHFQLHHKKNENVIYAATLGNLTEGRIELLQKAIDKRNPAGIIIAVDNDNAGTRFHINLLNKLEPARAYVPLPGSEQPVAQARPKEVDFSAQQAGKYHTHFDVSLKHSNPSERNDALHSILAKLSRLNALHHPKGAALPKEMEGEKLKVEFINTSPAETNLQIRLKNMDLPLIETLAAELHKEREMKVGIGESFIVRHKPVHKDFNDDLKVSKGIGAGTENKKELKGEGLNEKPGNQGDKSPFIEKEPAKSVKISM